jgi:CheY-like chemotaxis protein
MNLRILIVEDDPMNAKLFDADPHEEGRCRVEVEDPAYVIEEARAGRVDLIMDVSLNSSPERRPRRGPDHAA